MAEFTYLVEDFSLTTTWKRVASQQGTTTVPMGYDIVPGRVTKTIILSDLNLEAGEHIKRAVLTATLKRIGTTDYSEFITVNGYNFSTGVRKLNVEEFVPGGTWDVVFSFRATGNVGEALYNVPQDHYCTLCYSDISLTITTGTGSSFDGMVSS